MLPGGKKGAGGGGGGGGGGSASVGGDKKPVSKGPPAEAPPKSSAPPKKSQTATGKVRSQQCTSFIQKFGLVFFKQQLGGIQCVLSTLLFSVLRLCSAVSRSSQERKSNLCSGWKTQEDV